MLRNFFLMAPGDPDRDVQVANRRLQSTLVVGPSYSGKTTLLFNYAYNLVASHGYHNVMFVCKHNSMKEDPPFLPHDFDTTSEHLAKISFKYVSDDEDLDKYFAALHLAKEPPEAVLIDNFSGLFGEWLYEKAEGEGQPMEVAMVNSLSLCLDAMEHASKRMEPAKPCQLLVTDTQDENMTHLHVLEKYLSPILRIKALGSSMFLLSDQSGLSARYNFQDSPVHLESITRLGLDEHSRVESYLNSGISAGVSSF